MERCPVGVIESLPVPAGKIINNREATKEATMKISVEGKTVKLVRKDGKFYIPSKVMMKKGFIKGSIGTDVLKRIGRTAEGDYAKVPINGGKRLFYAPEIGAWIDVFGGPRYLKMPKAIAVRKELLRFQAENTPPSEFDIKKTVPQPQKLWPKNKVTKKDYYYKMDNCPRVAEKREILMKEYGCCKSCGSKVHISLHHKSYGKSVNGNAIYWTDPGSTPLNLLVLLCSECHGREHKARERKKFLLLKMDERFTQEAIVACLEKIGFTMEMLDQKDLYKEGT